MLSKDSASREQHKISLLIFYPEAQPMLSKDSASREQYKISSPIFLLQRQPLFVKERQREKYDVFPTKFFTLNNYLRIFVINKAETFPEQRAARAATHKIN